MVVFTFRSLILLQNCGLLKIIRKLIWQINSIEHTLHNIEPDFSFVHIRINIERLTSALNMVKNYTLK